jgi:hypothetical protein
MAILEIWMAVFIFAMKECNKLVAGENGWP